MAIPGSPMPEICVRISLSVCKATVPAAHQVKRQSILMPTDQYKACVLGWLIWSTYVHQLALRNASLGAPLEKGRFKKDFIFTEAAHNGKGQQVAMDFLRHLTKDSFEAWLGGKEKCDQVERKRWLVIMFPWDMGDVDKLNATFGPLGDLFTMPRSESQSCIQGASAFSQGTKPFTPVEPELVQSMFDEDDKLNDGDTEMDDGDGNVKENAGDVEGRKNGNREVTESLRGTVDQTDQTYPAFGSYREQPSCSGDEQSR